MLTEGSSIARVGPQTAGDVDWPFELKGNKTGGGKSRMGLRSVHLGPRVPGERLGSLFGLQHLGRHRRGSGGRIRHHHGDCEGTGGWGE